MPRSPRRPPEHRARAKARAKTRTGRKPGRKPAPRPANPRLIVFNKPFGVLCQFTDAARRTTLADYIDIPGVYPAGRLDRDSEGLLVLTNDGQLQARICDPAHELPKTYWAQVEGEPTAAQLSALRAGPVIKDGPTRPAEVEILAAPDLWPRHPPIRHRPSVPTTWLEITIREGRNRQVRRMTAAVGLPTLRLVRNRIGDWTLASLPIGQWRALAIPAALSR